VTEEKRQVTILRVREVLRGPHVHAHGPRTVLLQGGLHPRLQLVRQLPAVGTEELDAVVLHRVVGRGDHHARRTPQLPHQVRHRRGWEDPGLEDAGASGAESRHQGGLQHGARDPGVPGQQVRPASQDRGCGAPHGQGQLGPQGAVGYPADPVRPEQAPQLLLRVPTSRPRSAPESQLVLQCYTQAPWPTGSPDACPDPVPERALRKTGVLTDRAVPLALQRRETRTSTSAGSTQATTTPSGTLTRTGTRQLPAP
jgi:hypothetical protein